MTLDLKSPQGLAVFKRLADKADVIIENFRPDVKTRLGIDYDTLSKTNPGLVYGSISGFGQTGPYAKRPGFDQIAQGMGGLMSITGLAGPRTGARRHTHRGPDLRPIPRQRHPDGTARARSQRQGPVGDDLAAAGTDLHARFPGRPLGDRRRSAGAGRQQPSDQHPDRRVQDRRRAYQYRGFRPGDLHAVVRGDRRAGTRD